MNHPNDGVGRGSHPPPPWSEETLVSIAIESRPEDWSCIIESHRTPTHRSFLTTKFVTAFTLRDRSARLTVGRHRFDSDQPASLFNPPDQTFWLNCQSLPHLESETPHLSPDIAEGVFNLISERLRNTLIREAVKNPVALELQAASSEPENIPVSNLTFEMILQAITSERGVDWRYSVLDQNGAPPRCEARFSTSVADSTVELIGTLDSAAVNNTRVAAQAQGCRLLIRTKSGATVTHAFTPQQLEELFCAAQKQITGGSRP